jgi:alkyl sulfatase BDS1-like metallo-beta-lactamase superfamily hydrolase
VESARRYVDCIGGTDAVVAKARGYLDDGDLRFAAQLLKHAVFADPDHKEAKDLLAQTFERLGHGAENGTWRNFYLMGATELREGIGPAPIPDLGAGMAAALTVEQLFDSIAIRVNGPKAWSETMTIDWHLTDIGERYRMTLSNGVLVHYPNPGPGDADLSFTLTKPQLLAMLAGGGLEGVGHQGDLGVLQRLLSVLETPASTFAFVTP